LTLGAAAPASRRARFFAQADKSAASEERRRTWAEERSMNLVVWLPSMFALGLVGIGLCLMFVEACEYI
jgi:hypothetical protein